MDAASEMERNLAKKLYNPRVEHKSGGAARSLLSLSLFRRVPSGTTFLGVLIAARQLPASCRALR